MNGVLLYIIIHFGGDIVRPKIGSIIIYVGGSTKLTSLRAHLSYKDFVTILEETSEIHREDCKWLSTTKDTDSSRGLSTTKARGPLRYNSFPNPEPEYKGYPETNGRGFDPRRFRPFVDDENDFFETIRTDVPPSNEPSIPQSNVHLSMNLIHLSNEPLLTNVPPSNEPMLTNVSLSIKPEPIIGQTETSDARQLSARILTTCELLCRSELYDPICHRYTLIWHFSSMVCHFFRYGVAYTNHIESWNNVILKVRDLSIHVFIKELRRIYSEMSYTYREKVEKSQAHLTPWATDHC
ncbi:hypothetical protein GIB67_013578 [Kingdonia uniflora]|uniref:Uncharacterized protein n=1 Tax=Kingdonia uniflora TaxID=39325 RepID=A0A7J7KUZ8_9MAGN|nr:hypothetical protein GIB67_013578 [Kingdonia uniflora]